MRSAPVLLYALLLCGCPGGRPSQDAPAPPPAGAAAAPAGAPAQPPAGAMGPTPWQQRCAASLGAALGEAARLEPALRRGRAQPGRTPHGREQVAIAMFPPHDPLSLHLWVERPPREPRTGGAGSWQRSTEILEGRAFLSSSRRTVGGEASMLLDGWDGRLADAVASLLEPAVDRCLE